MNENDENPLRGRSNRWFLVEFVHLVQIPVGRGGAGTPVAGKGPETKSTDSDAWLAYACPKCGRLN